MGAVDQVEMFNKDIRWEQDPATKTWTAFDVPIFQAGFAQGRDWPLEFCEHLVKLDAELHDLINPRVGVGHAPANMATTEEIEAWETAQPACGWFGKLKLAGRTIFAESLAKIPDWLKVKIDAGEYGPVSPEIRPQFQHPVTGKVYKWVLDRVRFLGLHPPAMPNLGIHPVLGAVDRGGVVVLQFSEGAIVAELVGGIDYEVPSAGAKPKEGESMGETEKLQAEQAKLEEARAAQEAREKGIGEREKKLRSDRLTFAWDRMIAAEKVQPGERELFFAIGLELDDETPIRMADNSSMTRLGQHVASWEGRPDKLYGKKSASTAGGDTNESKDKGDFQDRAIAFADQFVRDGKGDFSQGLGAFEKTITEEELGGYREQFRGDPPVDVLQGAITFREGRG
jgi:hypothetical protein